MTDLNELRKLAATTPDPIRKKVYQSQLAELEQAAAVPVEKAEEKPTAKDVVFARTVSKAAAVRKAGPKYPNINVKLVGEDGNAFSILGRVKRAMKDGGASKEDMAAFMSEATSGDYDHLLQTFMNYVNTEGGEDEDDSQNDDDDIEDAAPDNLNKKKFPTRGRFAHGEPQDPEPDGSFRGEDPDDAIDESDNPSSGWRVPDGAEEDTADPSDTHQDADNLEHLARNYKSWFDDTSELSPSEDEAVGRLETAARALLEAIQTKRTSGRISRRKAAPAPLRKDRRTQEKQQ